MYDSLGDRCKAYEQATATILPPRIPKIIRLDGRSFHTVLRNAKRPYDENVRNAMALAAKDVMEDIGGTARFAYIQSDEVTIALNDALTNETQMFFGGDVQKITSVTASMMSVRFNHHLNGYLDLPRLATFDSRVFCVPEKDLVNVVLWRQQDASRNSVQQYARHFFSHKQVEGKNVSMLQEMMFQQENFNWNDAPTWSKRGFLVDHNKEIQWEIPVFSQDRDYLMNMFAPPISYTVLPSLTSNMVPLYISPVIIPTEDQNLL